MDQASASEQAFAMRTAVASKKIREWLEELSTWSWPSNSGSGFEMPPAKRRKLSEPETPGGDRKGKLPESDPTLDTDYCGSLPAATADHYEKRVEKIQQELDTLDLEEIKSQVLHNHILPLSRPNSPFSEGGRSSIGSASMFAKMEDLTAVVTAITIQALPNLSRLTRLLNTWSVRLLVLRKVPSLLTMIMDAEVALHSGWGAMKSGESSPTESNGHQDNSQTDDQPSLSRKDFDVMKRVIQSKVTRPGRALDYMLDLLEGSVDTLPDEWLDRMETIERNYAVWETTAERKVRAGEDSTLFDISSSSKHARAEPETPRPKIQIHGPSPTKDFPEPSDVQQFASPPTPSGFTPDSRASKAPNTSTPELSKGGSGAILKGAAIKILVDEPSRDIPGSTSQVVDLTKHAAHQRDIDTGAAAKNLSLNYDGARERQPTTESGYISPVLGEVDRNIVRNPPQDSKKPVTYIPRELTLPDDPESSVLEHSALEPVDEEAELDLPPARFPKRIGSRESIASTVIHAGEYDYSDNIPSRDGSMEPDLPRLPDPEEPFSSDALSPPSSPPLRYKGRSTSVTFKDVPEINTFPEASSTPPRSPLDPPEIFDPDTSFDYDSQLGSPGRMSTVSSNSEDEHFQQQLTGILESMPGKFRLEKRPGVNLNPPDLKLPSRPKSKTPDLTRRSNSSLSSRAGTPSSYSRSGTPSFMLQPARENRSRAKNSQGIRVYHLTRPTGEPPLKLLIRPVGENGERVMVRIGGGWADLGEYLREYAIHHSSRSKGEGKVDIRDVPGMPSGLGSSPSSRPGSAMGSPVTPLAVRKTRRSLGAEGAQRPFPKTPLSDMKQGSPSSDTSARSRASSHAEWDEEDSALGLAGPKGKRVDMSDESRKWVESVKEKVRIASGERIPPPEQRLDTKFGEIGKVGGTKRLFRKT